MKRDWILLLTSLVAGAALLALSFAGEMLLDQINFDAVRLALSAALVVFVLLAVNVRLLAPPRPDDGEVAIVFPVHWGTFFPLGVLIGTLVGLAGVSLIGTGLLAGTAHTYEVVGQIIGWVVILAIAFRRAPFMAGAFALGYGLALPSIILFLDPANDPVLTYIGHVSLMFVAAGLVVFFGGFVRIKIVD